jgi:hypothetical protein
VAVERHLSDGFIDVLVHGQDIAIPYDATGHADRSRRTGAARVRVTGWP